MTLDYTVDGQVSIDMTDYVKYNYPNDLSGKKVASPWNDVFHTILEMDLLIFEVKLVAH